MFFLPPSPGTARMHRICQPEDVYRTKLGVGGVGSVDLNKTSLLGCECCDELALPYFVAFIENARRCQQNLIPDTRCEAIQYQPDMLTTRIPLPTILMYHTQGMQRGGVPTSRPSAPLLK